MNQIRNRRKEMINQIVKQDNEFITSLTELKKAGNPLVLWGAGIFAGRLYDYLIKNDIQISAFVVDEVYYKEGLTVCNQVVWSAESYFEQLEEKCDVIITFVGYQESIVEKYKDKISKIYAYDFCGMFAMGPLNVMTQRFIEENKDNIKWLEQNLEDQASKTEIIKYINQKITGEYRTEYYENQYFSSDIIRLNQNEIFVDCGAYTGDSIESFLENLKESHIDDYGSIYAFEPDETNRKILQNNLNSLHNLHVIAGGAWDKNGTLTFDTEANTGSKISEEGKTAISVYAIDDVLDGEKATFIKMDIEGAELRALHGARKTILQYKPKLAICVYHNNEDIFEIPKYIKSLVPEYKLYYRKHAETATEMVLYAVI